MIFAINVFRVRTPRERKEDGGGLLRILERGVSVQPVKIGMDVQVG